MSTKPIASGIRSAIIALASSDTAVWPVTAASTPGSAVGMTSSRRVSSAWTDSSSVPAPASGIETSAMRPSSLDRTVIGSDISPVAIACSRSRATPSRTAAAGPSTATIAGSGPPGNAAWMRS